MITEINESLQGCVIVCRGVLASLFFFFFPLEGTFSKQCEVQFRVTQEKENVEILVRYPHDLVVRVVRGGAGI